MLNRVDVGALWLSAIHCSLTYSTHIPMLSIIAPPPCTPSHHLKLARHTPDPHLTYVQLKRFLILRRLSNQRMGDARHAHLVFLPDIRHCRYMLISALLFLLFRRVRAVGVVCILAARRHQHHQLHPHQEAHYWYVGKFSEALGCSKC